MKESTPVFQASNNVGLPRARARYLTQAISLEEEGPAGIIRAAIYFSLTLFFVLLYWSSITDISEVAVTTGKVLPAGLIHNIQHLEGGIVESIVVKNGDTVNQGDILMTFTPPATESDFRKMRIRQLTLQLQLERLQALIESQAPDFFSITQEYDNIVQRQQTIYDAQLLAHKYEKSTVDQQIEQKEGELVRNKNQIQSIKKEIKLLEEQVTIRERLTSNGLVARTELLVTQSNLLGSLRKLRDHEDSSAFASSAIQEKIRYRAELTANFQRDNQLEAGKLLNQLAEVKQELVRLKDRFERLKLIAPVKGIVQALGVTSINAVVEPGEVIMLIVPVDDELIVEARITPKDIGHVSINHEADIKVDSYDSARFGSVQGRVKQISATTYLDERQQPYYRAEISLNKSYVGKIPQRNRIIPGMTVQANIKIGSKTLLDYLMKPISRGFSGAFHER